MRNIASMSLAVLLASAAAPAQEPLKVCMLSGSAEYKSQESLEGLRKHLEENYGAKCFLCPGKDGGTDLPGLEALDGCDVMLVFCRRMKLPPEQVERIKKHCAAGKAVVGVRTASHAFQPYLAFDAEVLGGSYKGHGKDELAQVEIDPPAKDHLVLAGVRAFTTMGKMYRNPELAKDATVLLRGKTKDNAEPLAWVRQRDGGRVFYTSMGTPEDFANEDFRRMLVNAIFWTAKRDVPKAASAPTKPAASPGTR